MNSYNYTEYSDFSFKINLPFILITKSIYTLSTILIFYLIFSFWISLLDCTNEVLLNFKNFLASNCLFGILYTPLYWLNLKQFPGNKLKIRLIWEVGNHAQWCQFLLYQVRYLANYVKSGLLSKMPYSEPQSHNSHLVMWWNSKSNSTQTGNTV